MTRPDYQVNGQCEPRCDEHRRRHGEAPGLSPAATARSRNPKHWSTADKTIRFRGAALWLEIEIGATEGAPELGMSTESDNDRPGANIMVRNVFRNAFRAGSSTSTRMIESSVTTT